MYVHVHISYVCMYVCMYVHIFVVAAAGSGAFTLIWKIGVIIIHIGKFESLYMFHTTVICSPNNGRQFI